MNIETLIEQIENTDWLSQAKHILTLSQLQIEWDWLPTSRDQSNPFVATYTAKPDEQRYDKETENRVYKAALKSLRSVGNAHPKLVDGPHNYTESMKGSALFACKHAAKEVLSNQPGKWLTILALYKNGVWPCGITQTGELVIL
ncbi:hypothetical protein [Shewanella seohaensis]|uniref:Uncharacterized protein n=1 Tax=Shewanella seohaensis TaxID=755175 RepID=A0ABV4VYZ3_9GAMM